jgi:3-deoxy-D-manno-octulosonate 8-phosphate phosphatase (KDO 8-P phosphatase)
MNQRPLPGRGLPVKDNNALVWQDFKLLVSDVDGVLTDGTVLLHPDGTESKRFNLQDGHGIKMWKRAGLEIALLSGRASPATQRRAEQLQIEHVIEGAKVKLPQLQGLMERLGVTPAQTVYIGDDLLDVLPVQHVGLGVAVANAVFELKRVADVVTEKAGGEGAVREVIEMVLKRSGRWETLMERYRV